MADKEIFHTIEILPGVDKDNTALSTPHYTDADKIRFYRGQPQKLGGWDQLTFNGGAAIEGCTRTIYSQRLGDSIFTLYGTNEYLYSQLGTELTNITPLVTATTNLRTVTTLANNPLATTNLSTTVVVTHTAHGMTDGVTIEISGVPGDVNGIPQAQLNATHVITYINANSYSITVASAATSTASGGGSAVVETHGNMATNYGTLTNNPITTVNGSKTITIAHTAHKLVAGDTVTLSGATTTNGVPNTDINALHLVRSTTANSYDITVATAATSSGSGGGAGVVEATYIITVTQTAHGFSNGNRIGILASTAVGGIPLGEINAEHIISNVSTDAYDIRAVTFATSAATGAGGAVTTVQGQIASGECDAQFGVGYGMGLYGVGLYGVASVSSGTLILPRIYSMDRYGDLVILTPGGQTGVYSWDGDSDVAPALVTNAPTAVNYVFSSDNIAVVLGSGGVINRVKWSDQGDLTDWTATSTNQAGEDDIEGAGMFFSQARVRGINLLFTEDQVYTMRYIGAPLVWEIKELEGAQGLIAQNARVVVNGICYWMGQQDFYQYNGGVVSSIGSNSQDGINYLRNYVFNDLNSVQKYKNFAWFNPFYNEIWFHYCSSDSDEPNRVARYSINEKHWVPDTFNRTAAEYPRILNIYPRLISHENNVYRHEKGVNNVDAALPFSLTSPLFQAENTLTKITRVVPDSVQTGSIDFEIKTLPWAQTTSQPMYMASNATPSTTQTTIPVSPTLNHIDGYITNRLWQYTWSQDVVDGNWRKGAWIEVLEKGTPD